jgi:hypothetical protein
MTLMTIGLAISGVILGFLSLGWQAWTWRAAGARIRVDTTSGGVGRTDGSGFAGVVVTARNHGHLAAHLTGWGVLCRLSDGKTAWFPYPSEVEESDPVDTTLQPQHQAQWWARNEDLLKVASEPMEIAGYVRLGTGSNIVSKQWVGIP